MVREAWAGLLLAVAAVSALAGSPAEAVTASYADALKLPPDAAYHAGYLWLGDVPEAQRVAMIQLVRYNLNAVSTEPDLIQPVLVGKELLRIDRRDPGPAFAVAWEKTADVDPIFHLAVEIAGVDYEEVPRETREDKNVKGYFWARNDAGTDWVPATSVPKTVRRKKAGASSKRAVLATQTIEGCPTCRGWLPTTETLALAELTHSNSPVLGAQWWWARASRQLPLSNREDGTGYYDWQGWKTRDDFFATLHIRKEDQIRILRGVVAAGSSGVAQNGRQIENDDGVFGRYWFTLDVNAPDGERSVTHHLRRGDLTHDAEEWYAPGANGLPKLLLSDAKGVLQATAPDFIGGDGSPGYGGRDLRIHVGLSCIDCHAEKVLLPVDDWTRKTFTGGVKLQSPDYQTARDFQRELLSQLEPQRARDAAGMIAAMEAAGGLKVAALVKATDDQWRAYAVTPLSADDYGLMLGCDGKTLTAAVREAYRVNPVGGVEPALAPLLADKGVISRTVAEEFAATTHAYLWSYKP